MNNAADTSINNNPPNSPSDMTYINTIFPIAFGAFPEGYTASDDETSSTTTCSPAEFKVSSLPELQSVVTNTFTPAYAHSFSYFSDIPTKPPGWIADSMNKSIAEPNWKHNSMIGFLVNVVNGRVTINYLETYRNAGKIEVKLHGNLMLGTGHFVMTTAENKNKHPRMIPCCMGKFDTYGAIIDTYNANLNVSSITEKTLHFDITGYLELMITHIPLTQAELKERGGDKVKIVGITVC